MNRLKLKIISILIGLVLGLFFGELATRMHYFGSDAFHYQRMKSFQHIGKTGIVRSVENQKITFGLKPNLNQLFKLKQFTTNGAGFRDKAYPLEKGEKTIRAAVFGDSFTMGVGVEINEVFHSRCEEMLNERNDDFKYEFINFGVSGYNLYSYEGLLEEKVPRYKPDWVLIGFCSWNDFNLPRPQQKGELPFEVKPKENAFWYSYLYKFLSTRLGISKLDPGKNKLTKEKEGHVSRMFASYKSFSEAHQIPIVIQYLALSKSPQRYHIIDSLAHLHGLPLIALSETFKKGNPKRFHFHKMDHHPNAAAHEIYANSLFNSEAVNEIIHGLKKEKMLFAD